MTKRIVITGMGAITPLGNNVKSFFKNSIEGFSAIEPDDQFSKFDFSTTLSAKVKNFNIKDYIKSRKILKLLNKGEEFILASVKQAIDDSRININRDFSDQSFGLFLGCNKEFAPFDRITGVLHESINDNGNGIDNDKFAKIAIEEMQPLLILESIPNACIEYISEAFNVRGENSQFMTTGVASLQAIGAAYVSITEGNSIAAICGGFDSLMNPFDFGNFSYLDLMTSSQTEEDFHGPFDAYRDGFVMGEGAGALILEEYNHAVDRGAPIYAELSGYYSNTEAQGLAKLEESGNSLSQCIKNVLVNAEMNPNDITFINAYSSGTQIGDKSEINAIKDVFGKTQAKLYSNKGAIGHLIGGSGAVETISTVMALNTGIVPPNVNIKKLDPKFDPLMVYEEKLKLTNNNAALKISRGLGSQNAALILKK